MTEVAADAEEEGIVVTDEDSLVDGVEVDETEVAVTDPPDAEPLEASEDVWTVEVDVVTTTDVPPVLKGGFWRLSCCNALSILAISDPDPSTAVRKARKDVTASGRIVERFGRG